MCCKIFVIFYFEILIICQRDKLVNYYKSTDISKITRHSIYEQERIKLLKTLTYVLERNFV